MGAYAKAQEKAKKAHRATIKKAGIMPAKKKPAKKKAEAK